MVGLSHRSLAGNTHRSLWYVPQRSHAFASLTEGVVQGYPEPNTGWMNEEGVRIDIVHCLIPKPPLRSALKRPKAGAGTQ